MSYDSPRRRGGSIWPADAHTRQVPADSHCGTTADFLRRYERESAIATCGTAEQRAQHVTRMLKLVADPRNLRLALDHINRYGGEGTGPDNLRPDDHGTTEWWDRLRTLGKMIRAGTYRPGPVRTVKIPKGNGHELRTIQVQNLDDRIVQRGILQILQPYLDPKFAATSFGYRPGKGREHALALAEALAIKHRSWTWRAEDIQDAFDNVPVKRLLEIIKRQVPADDLLTLIENVIGTTNKRGIPQGGALSPLLLNVYLDHVLDRLWARRHPDVPLIRVADDLLLLTRNRDQAVQMQEALAILLTPAAMPLKAVKSTLRDLADGQVIGWLGYDVRMGNNCIDVNVSEKSWDRLDDNLSRLHDQPYAPIRAIETIEGWIMQQGPCYRPSDVRGMAKRIDCMARPYAFVELPSIDRTQSLWESAHEQWEQLRQSVQYDSDHREVKAAPPGLSNAGAQPKPATGGAPTGGALPYILNGENQESGVDATSTATPPVLTNSQGDELRRPRDMTRTRSHDPVTTPGKPAPACPRLERSQDLAQKEVYHPKKIRSDVNPDPPKLSVLRPPMENGHSPGRSPRNGRAHTASNACGVEVEPTSKPTKPSGLEAHATEATCKMRLEELEKTAKVIRDHHKKVCGAYRTSLEHAIHAGTLLLKVKRELEHGRFSPWVKKMCKVSPRTAREYMQIAEAVDEGLIDLNDPKRRPAAVFNRKQILKQLAKPRAKPPESDTDPETTTTTNATDPASADPAQTNGEQQRPDRRDQDDHHDSHESTTAEAGATATAQRNSRAAAEGTGQGDATTARNPTEGLDDEAWLATLPIRSQLADPAGFDEESLQWRRVQPAIDLLRKLYSPCPDDLKPERISGASQRRYSHALATLVGFKPPEQWVLCPECEGQAKVRIRNKPCGVCRRAGYLTTREGDQIQNE